MKRHETRIDRRRFLASSATLASATFAAPALLNAGSHSVPLLRIRLRDDPFPFDPVEGSYPSAEFVHRAVFPPLTRFNQNGWSPYLVESISEAHDFSGVTPVFRIRITLASGSSWASRTRDLEPVDVAKSILRARDAGRTAWQDVADVEFIDHRTLRLILTQQNVALWRETFPRSLSSVTYEGSAILDTPVTEVDTNGPYQVEEYVSDGFVTLLRRPDWHGGHVAVERARMMVIPDTSVAIAYYEAGRLDIIDVTQAAVGSSQQRNFREFNESFIEARPTDRVYFLGMDNSSGATEDSRTRQAITTALDRAAILAAAYGEDQALPAIGVVPSQYPGALTDPSEASQGTGNLDLAKDLLRQAGMESGFDTTLWVPAAFGSPGENMAREIREQLSRIGVRVSLQSLEPGQPWWFRDGGRRELFLDRTFAANDPATTLQRFQSFSEFNTPAFQNAQFDELYKMNLVTEGEERIEVFREMQSILASEAAILPLAQPNNLWMIREGTVLPTFASNGQLGDILDFQPQA